MQRALPRLALCVFTGVALVLIFGVFAPWWFGSDRSLASVAGQLYRELQRGDSLDRRDERMRRCLEAKRRITAEVLAGRLSLEEAAEAFRESNAAAQDGNEAWAGTYRTYDEDDAEAVYRNVIVWVRQSPSQGPERKAATIYRLEEELRQLRQSRAAGAL